jgi:hypothetical protein
MMLSAITGMQGKAMAVGNAVLFRAFDFHAPPPIAVQAMEQAQGE